MLKALIQGKLSSEQENSEDLLTSGVLGLLSYLPPDQGLLPFLSLSRFEDGATNSLFESSGLHVTGMNFWPLAFLEETGWTEPDVLIEVLNADGQWHIILVEVKLWSDKSGRPDFETTKVRDQLAREWMILVNLCRAKKTTPHFIFITSDLAYPREDVREANMELSIKAASCVDKFPFRCCWLPWFLVVETFRTSTSPALRDIAAACDRLDLGRFAGITPITPTNETWSIDMGHETYQFAIPIAISLWSYK